MKRVIWLIISVGIMTMSGCSGGGNGESGQSNDDTAVPINQFEIVKNK